VKILLDECVTKHLKKYLSDFEVSTVRELGIGGIKNGKLMAFCVANNFEILLTIDKNMLHQQNLEKYPISLIVFDAKRSNLAELLPFIANFKSTLKSFERHKAYLLKEQESA